MYIIHHYLQRGFTFEYILEKQGIEKDFMIASALKQKEEEAENLETLLVFLSKLGVVRLG